MNREPIEQRLMEMAEELVDYHEESRRLERRFITQLADYCEERKIIRAFDRLGLDSVWATREIAYRTRRKGGQLGEDDNEAA